MIIKANIEMGMQSLFASKQRSLLALLGIIIGIGAVIALVSIGNITQEESLRQFKESGTDFVVIEKGWGDKNFGDFQPKITMKQAEELTRYVPDLLQATPIGTTGGSMSFQGKNITGGIIATRGDFLAINRLKLKAGRYLSDLDINMPYCVLGIKMVQQLKESGASDIIGSEIKINDSIYTVIGFIEEANSGGMEPFNANNSLFIPYSTFDRTFDDAEISNIIGRMKDGALSSTLVNDIKNYFAIRDPELSIEIQTADALIAQMNQQTQMFSILLTGIGGISLLVGGIGVMNVMLVSVSERKQEIGIRRALGALQGDIQFQFIIESLVLCTIGGMLGVIAGLGAAYGYAYYNHYSFILSSQAVVLGVVVSTTIGLFFGYYPARQASKLDPIVALRSS